MKTNFLKTEHVLASITAYPVYYTLSYHAGGFWRLNLLACESCKKMLHSSPSLFCHFVHHNNNKDNDNLMAKAGEKLGRATAIFYIWMCSYLPGPVQCAISLASQLRKLPLWVSFYFLYKTPLVNWTLNFNPGAYVAMVARPVHSCSALSEFKSKAS